VTVCADIGTDGSQNLREEQIVQGCNVLVFIF
jgi:hypothetical protein